MTPKALDCCDSFAALRSAGAQPRAAKESPQSKAFGELAATRTHSSSLIVKIVLVGQTAARREDARFSKKTHLGIREPACSRAPDRLKSWTTLPAAGGEEERAGAEQGEAAGLGDDGPGEDHA